jgi:hypothetical protein
METDASACIDNDGLSWTDVTAAVEVHFAVSPYFVCRTSYGELISGTYSVDRIKTLDEGAKKSDGIREGVKQPCLLFNAHTS